MEVEDSPAVDTGTGAQDAGLLADELLERFGAHLGMRSLDDAQVWLELLKPREAKQGDLVCSRGGESHSIYLVLSGKLDVCLTEDGRIHVVALLRQGDVFGELGLLAPGLGQADVLVTEAARLVELDRAGYERMRATHPRLVQHLLHGVSERLAGRIAALPGSRSELFEARWNDSQRQLSRELYRSMGSAS